MADVANSIVKELNQRLTAVSVPAVGTSLALWAALSALTIIAFSILRPANAAVYAPKYKYSEDGKRPPKINSGFLSWITPLIKVKEDDMVSKLGMDAVVFLRFSRMLRWMFMAIAALCCGVLIPVDLIYNLNKVDAGDRDVLSTITIQNVRGASLYAHVAVSYGVTIIVCWFIWFNYGKVIDLRMQWFRSYEYQESLAARSLMITQVGKRMQTDEGLNTLLSSLQIPYPTISVHIARRFGELPELIEYHSNTVKQLEQVLTTHLKKGKIPDKRPTLRTGGFLGMGGQKHDAIDYLTAKVTRLENKIEAARDNIDQRKSLPYGFASFLKVPYAHVVARKLEKKTYKGSVIELAPQPNDIIWENLTKSRGAKRWAQFFGGLILSVVMVLYVIPVVAVSALSNLAALTVYVRFLRDWQSESKWTFSAVAGILPPLLSIILQLILPMIMRALSKYQGATTHTKAARDTLGRYYFFLVVTNLLIFSLVGIIFNMVASIIAAHGNGDFVLNELSEFPKTLQRSYIQQSNYWLTFFPLRGFNAIFDLAQIINLLYIWIKTRLWGRTPRDIREYCKPPAFQYEIYGANTLLMVTVALVYCSLAPAVVLLAAMVFFAQSWVFKFQLLYVFVSEIESGGRLWRMLINRLLCALVFAQLLMCLTVGLQLRYIMAAVAAPPILGIIIFKFMLYRRFEKKFAWYTPDPTEIAESRAHHSDEKKGRLARRFGHPALHAPLITPMVHKRVEHLLPQVYSGRLDIHRSTSKGELFEVGGLTFAALEEQNLELSRGEYLKEIRHEDAWETGSLASTALTGTRQGAKRSDSRELLQQNYLNFGPGAVDSTASLQGEAFGQPMDRVGTRDSHEQLIRAGAPPSYPYQQQPFLASRESLDLASRGARGPLPYASPINQSQEQFYDSAYPPRPFDARPMDRQGSQASLASRPLYSQQDSFRDSPPLPSDSTRSLHRPNPSQDSFQYARPNQQQDYFYHPQR